jgi:hypothetical protein
VSLRVVATGALAAAPIALAGCGGGGPSSKTLVGAADKTLSSSTFAANYDGSLRITGQQRAVSFEGSGIVDTRTHRTRVSVDLSSLAHESGATGDLSAFRGEEVVDSTADIVLYVRIPFYSRHLPASKPWLRIDYGKTVRQQGIAVNSLTLDQDPGQYLEYLRGATGKVEKVGEQAVQGVQTTHYRGSLYILDFPRVLTGARRTSAEHVADRIVQLTKESTFPTDVWIDGDDHVRRMTFDYAIPENGSTPAVDYRLTLEYSQFGQGVSVGLPPADEISRPTQLKTS